MLLVLLRAPARRLVRPGRACELVDRFFLGSHMGYTLKLLWECHPHFASIFRLYT